MRRHGNLNPADTVVEEGMNMSIIEFITSCLGTLALLAMCGCIVHFAVRAEKGTSRGK